MPTNKEFLTALFETELDWVHVTDFAHDPSNIPDGQQLRAWMGDYYSRYTMSPGTNQYFTISLFYADDKQKARRRKALFRSTPVIVLDDVREKLPIEEANRLPKPTWILESSDGSEQWGYKLDVPETDRGRVENLLDGLVSQGLAPQGKDPGMKGVTRYVRLPEGINNKANKLVDGQPFKCRITEWNPERTVSLAALAEPFAVNLDAPRREGRIDGAASVSDHPLLEVIDLIHIKEERSDGRFDISCPWVEEHTGAADNGTAIFTNSDGTIGFKCHHGVCEQRTGGDLLRLVEESAPGFGNKLKAWQLKRSFEQAMSGEAEGNGGSPVGSTPTERTGSIPVEDTNNFDFFDKPKAPAPPVAEVATPEEPITHYMDELRRLNPGGTEARTIAATLLKSVDTYATIDRQHHHEEIRDVMGWSKVDFKSILKDLRTEWYKDSTNEMDFFSEVVFVKELNQFFDRDKRIFYSPEAYHNSYSSSDEEAKKNALQGGMVTKVDKLDYAPKQPPIFTRGKMVYGNSWSEHTEVKGVKGDVSCWLNHFDTLGFGVYKEHIINWMAFTLQHPDKKINHMILMGGPEGGGKDFQLHPLKIAMGENHTTIDGEELLSQFKDWAIGCKYLHINEAELGDHHEAKAISAKLKPLAAAPPDQIRANQKGIKPIKITNLISSTMTTNSQLPFTMNGDSRRFLALWSDLNIRDEDGNMKPEWVKFWTEAWEWMKNGGAEAVIYYLRNEVDVSKFNPGAAPPATQFLRDIRDASKSPMQQTIEAFIKNRIGCFGSDLVTAQAMSETFRAGALLDGQFMYSDPKFFTPTRIGCIMREMTSVAQVRGRSKFEDVRLWAVRDVAIYQALGPADIYKQYADQMSETRKNATIRAVS